MADSTGPISRAFDSMSELRTTVEQRIGEASSLQLAGQRFADTLFDSFESSLVMARVYGVVRARELPTAERAFAAHLAGLEARQLADETLVLSLWGTRGAESSWNDRSQSQAHLAIPLVDAEFVDGIPMIARLLSELGVDLVGLQAGEHDQTRPMVGGFNGLFYVANPTTERDHAGRLIIPQQDFVRRHDVRCVFGMGGSYVSEILVVAILFSSEPVKRETAERLATLISRFKMSTAKLAVARQVF